MKRAALAFITPFIMLFASLAVAGDEVSPMAIDGATTVDTAKSKVLYDEGALFVDVRSSKDWGAGRIPDAVHIELKKVFSEDTLGKEAGKNDVIVIYCNGEKCLRSSVASEKAVAWGFTKVHYYRDGFPAWKKAGFPVE